jgi:hypothetical protein
MSLHAEILALSGLGRVDSRAVTYGLKPVPFNNPGFPLLRTG